MATIRIDHKDPDLDDWVAQTRSTKEIREYIFVENDFLGLICELQIYWKCGWIKIQQSGYPGSGDTLKEAAQDALENFNKKTRKG